MDLSIYALIEAVWLILPAYAANAFATLPRGHRRMDFGNALGGKPILGAGKTWEGFVFGVIVAMIISLVQLLAFPYLPWDASPVALVIAPMGLSLGFLLGLGTMSGDAVGSFIKRRFNMKRGRSAPILDQLDFLIGALLFASLLVAIKLEWVIILVVMTPLIHLVANGFGYLLRVKKEPY